MPYDASKVSELPENVQKLDAKKRRQWVDIFNSAMARCQKSGKSQRDCEGSSFAQANGVVKVGSANNSAGFSSAETPIAAGIAEFELPVEPGAVYDDGEIVYRYGRLFRAGDYPDKSYAMSSDELKAAVEAFTEPVPIDIEHVPSVLDDKLGQVVSVEADGDELHGIVAIPKWLDSVLDERKVSATWDRATKTLKGLALVRSPRVSDAALMAAFNAANDCGCSDAEFKEWDTAYINDLPDSAFLFIEDGGEKDDEGKTKPRSLRHFPYKDASGAIDLPHLRNAIARIPQSNAKGLDKDALQKKAQGILERANHADESVPADLVEAASVLFARGRHNTPEGQSQLQALHDQAARYGAVCKSSNAQMASSHESTAIQTIHDLAADHGASCSAMKQGSLASPAYYSQDKPRKERTHMGWRENVAAAFAAALGQIPEDDEGTEQTAEQPKETEKPKKEAAATTMSGPTERENALMAELAAERERSYRLQNERIHEKAVAFSANVLRVEKRILPASVDALTALFEQLSIADGKLPAVTFADGSTSTYVGLLEKFVATLPKSPLTEELLSGSLHETIVALANRQQAVTPDTDRQLTQEELDAMLAKIPTGRAMLSERKNGKGN